MSNLIYLFFLIALNVDIITDAAYFLKQNYIDNINKEAKTWKAGINFDPNMPENDFLKLLGVKGLKNPKPHMYRKNDRAYDLSIEIPKSFDAREQWKMCHGIGKAIDQGDCGSCWAVSTSSVLADRLCIATNQTFNQMLSVEELTFCCQIPGCNGCSGTNPITSWVHMKLNGIVTGGEYNTKDGCAPYQVPPSHRSQNRYITYDKKVFNYHNCPRQCYGNTTIELESDRRYVEDFYFLSYKNIQRDIMTYGPVAATFWTYTDFASYKSGVYVLTNNAMRMEAHAVRVIGWGEENDTPYWLCVNSWSDKWGENGLFKIRRGTNECNIESWVNAATPSIG